MPPRQFFIIALDAAGFLFITALCAGYALYWVPFAEIHLEFSFLNFPVFIGEITLAATGILWLLREELNRTRPGPGWAFLGVYLAWVAGKAMLGYLNEGPLALRNAALFYYPLFGVFAFRCFRREWFRPWPCAGALAMFVVLQARIGVADYFILPCFALASILAWRTPGPVPRAVSFLALAAVFPYGTIFSSSRSFVFAVGCAGLFLLLAGIFGLAPLKRKSKLAMVAAGTGILVILLPLMLQRNQIRSLSHPRRLLKTFREQDRIVQDIKDNYIMQDLTAQLFNTDTAMLRSGRSHNRQEEIAHMRIRRPDFKELDIETILRIRRREILLARENQMRPGRRRLSPLRISLDEAGTRIKPASPAGAAIWDVLHAGPDGAAREGMPPGPVEEMKETSAPFPAKADGARPAVQAAADTAVWDILAAGPEKEAWEESPPGQVAEVGGAPWPFPAKAVEAGPQARAGADTAVWDILAAGQDGEAREGSPPGPVEEVGEASGPPPAKAVEAGPLVKSAAEAGFNLAAFVRPVSAGLAGWGFNNVQAILVTGLADAKWSRSRRTKPQEPKVNAVVILPPESINTEMSNINFRLFIWRDMIKEWWEHRPRPWFGLSFGHPQRSISLEILGQAIGEWSRDGWITPHNAWLHLIYRGGLVGLGIITLMITGMCRMTNAFLGRRSFQGLLLVATLIYWLVLSSFLVVLELPYQAIPFWTVWGLAAALAVRKHEARDVKTRAGGPGGKVDKAPLMG